MRNNNVYFYNSKLTNDWWRIYFKLVLLIFNFPYISMVDCMANIKRTLMSNEPVAIIEVSDLLAELRGYALIQTNSSAI